MILDVLVVPVYFGYDAIRHTFPVFPFEYSAQLVLGLFAALRALGQIEQVDAGVVRCRHHRIQLFLIDGRVVRGPSGQPDVGHPQSALSQIPVPEPGRQAGWLRGRHPVNRFLDRGRLLQLGAQLFCGAAQVGHAVQAGYRRLASASKNESFITTSHIHIL